MKTLVKDTESLAVINERTAKSIRNFLEGKLDSAEIDNINSRLEKMTEKYYHEIKILGALFYMHIWMQDDNDNWEFNGNAGVITLVSAGGAAGHIYTDDIDRLYRETTSFSYESAMVYFSVQFFNNKSELLGHFHSGGFGTGGVGGGSGKWKSIEH